MCVRGGGGCVCEGWGVGVYVCERLEGWEV